jgi:hypothetical protein
MMVVALALVVLLVSGLPIGYSFALAGAFALWWTARPSST